MCNFGSNFKKNHPTGTSTTVRIRVRDNSINSIDTMSSPTWFLYNKPQQVWQHQNIHSNSMVVTDEISVVLDDERNATTLFIFLDAKEKWLFPIYSNSNVLYFNTGNEITKKNLSNRLLGGKPFDLTIRNNGMKYETFLKAWKQLKSIISITVDESNKFPITYSRKQFDKIDLNSLGHFKFTNYGNFNNYFEPTREAISFLAQKKYEYKVERGGCHIGSSAGCRIDAIVCKLIFYVNYM